jgi:hypothetical protein
MQVFTYLISCKTETLHDFPCILKAGIFSLKRFSLLSLKSVFDFFIALEQLETRRDKFESILEIKESVVSKSGDNHPKHFRKLIM